MFEILQPLKRYNMHVNELLEIALQSCARVKQQERVHKMWLCLLLGGGCKTSHNVFSPDTTDLNVWFLLSLCANCTSVSEFLVVPVADLMSSY